MKIHSIHHQLVGRTANRLLAICGALLLGIATSDVAQAQGGFLDRLTAVESSDISLPSTDGSGQVNFGNEAFRVVTSSAVRTAGDRGNGPIQQTALLSCSSCGTSCGGSCGGSCGSCGTSCGGACGGYSACGSCGTSCGGSCGGGYASYSLGDYGGNACGIPCNPYWYATAEAIYMSREGKDQFTLAENITLSRRFDEFDYETAGRITIGRVPDCVHGCEVTFSGVLEWDFATSYTGTNIQTFLVPGDPVPASDLSSFINADFVSQRYEARYYSIEANRTLVGWDVSRLLYGVRYIDYDEEYRYDSAALGRAGVLFSETENALVGLQAGLEASYPISQHGWVDIRGRAGLFLDFAESNVQLINNNVDLVLLNEDDTTKLAAVFEFGSGVRYQVGEILSVRGGAEVWYISDVAAAGDQVRAQGGIVTPTLGRNIRVKEDIFFLGLNAGIELRF